MYGSTHLYMPLVPLTLPHYSLGSYTFIHVSSAPDSVTLWCVVVHIYTCLWCPWLYHVMVYEKWLEAPYSATLICCMTLDAPSSATLLWVCVLPDSWYLFLSHFTLCVAGLLLPLRHPLYYVCYRNIAAPSTFTLLRVLQDYYCPCNIKFTLCVYCMVLLYSIWSAIL